MSSCSPSPIQQSGKSSGSQLDEDLSSPDLGNELPRWCYRELECTRPKKKMKRSTSDRVDKAANKDMHDMKALLLKLCKKVVKNEMYLKELQHRLEFNSRWDVI